VCKEALQYAQLGNEGIDDIILVGGTTKIPYVRDEVTKFFEKTPRTDVSPEDAVALGAGLQATALERILKRRTTSRQPSRAESGTFVDPDTQTETLVAGATMADLEETNQAPALDFDDVVEELTAEQPKRQTAGYSEVMRAAEPARAPDRLPERGQHHDVFEERTPPPLPPSAAPLARLKPSGPPPSPSGAKTAPPMAAARPPATPSNAPVAPPQARTMMIEPEPAAQPTLVVPDPRAAHAAQTQVVPDPRGARGARTLVVPDPLAAPPPRLESVLSLEPEPSPSSTAKGFAPPQTYPVMQSPVILDVTPRGLGIGTVAGFCEELIRRNSRVPAEIRKVFVTGRDLQEAVRIIVVQGESRRMEGNMVLGDLTLSDIAPRPRGETSIEVTFHIDASGILQVRARDAQTGREQRASLDLVGAMPDQDVAASRERITALRR
jgi:molecular chaperone DnaK